MNDIILHIGMNKAGSSTLQDFLARHRRELRGRGLLYPQAGQRRGTNAHYDFSGAFGFITGEHRAEYTPDRAAGIVDRMAREIAAHPEHTVLVSSEFFVQTRDPAPVARFFGEHLPGRRLRVLIYLRRHDLWWQSAYSQAVLTRTDPPWPSGYRGYLAFQKRRRVQHLRYLRLIEIWAGLVGRENLLIRPFEPAQMPGGMIPDMAEAIGCAGALAGLDTDPPRSNMAIPGRVLHVVDALQRTALPPRQRRRLIRAVRAAGGSGPGLVFDADLRLELIADHAQDYAAIARDYLGRPDGILFRDPLPDPEAEVRQPRLRLPEVLELVARTEAAALRPWSGMRQPAGAREEEEEER